MIETILDQPFIGPMIIISSVTASAIGIFILCVAKIHNTATDIKLLPPPKGTVMPDDDITATAMRARTKIRHQHKIVKAIKEIDRKIEYAASEGYSCVELTCPMSFKEIFVEVATYYRNKGYDVYKDAFDCLVINWSGKTSIRGWLGKHGIEI